MMARGRGWAYTGATLGAVVSIAANVAHSYVPPAGAPAGWTPYTGAVIGAVFWPVGLLVVVEILARVPWPPGLRWVALRWFGLLPVAAVAAVVSYRHLSGLLAFYGEDTLTSLIGPLAVDGLMVMATGALIATAAHRADPVPTPMPVAVPVAMPVAPDIAADIASEEAPPVPAAPASPDETSPARKPTPVPKPRKAPAQKTKAAKRPPVTVDEVTLRRAQEAARVIRGRGEPVNRDTLAAELRRHGSIANRLVGPALQAIREEVPA